MFKQSAYWINRILWTLFVTVLVLLAAYVSMGRYYITYVEQYQQNLIDRFVEFSGLPLSATRLHGRWSKFSPILTVENLALYSPAQDGEPVLTINNISFQLDPLASLLNRSLMIKHLKFTGVHCELEEVVAAKWQLKGYPAGSGETDFDKVIDIMLSVDSVELNAATVQLNYEKGNTALLETQELSLLHDENFRRLRLQATFDKAANPLIAVIEAKGDPRDVDKFSAEAYIKLDDVDFTEQLPLIRSLGLNLHDAEVDSEVWVNWKPGRVISIQGKAAIPNLDWAAVVDSAARINPSVPTQEKPPLKNIKLSFRAEKSADNDWQLWLPNIQAQWGEQHFSLEQLQVGVQPDAIDVAFPVVSLDKFANQLISLQVLGEKGLERLQTLAPKGQLQNVHMHIALDSARLDAKQKTEQPRFLMRANLDNVGLSSRKGAPGAKGIDGFIEVTPKHGLVEFNSQRLSMHFPVIYHHWLDFTHSAGQVRWDIIDERVIVSSGPLKLKAEHGPAIGLLNLDLPLKKGGSDPLMTLAIGIHNTDARHRDKLIPYTLNKNFLDWMEDSLPTGHITTGGFIYRGSLVRDAKAHLERTMQLYLDVEDATLDYHPKWPKLDNIKGLVMIDDGEVDVITHHANIYGLTIEQARVSVKPLSGGGRWLTVDAHAFGEGSDALKVVTQSAIRDWVGSVFDHWQLQGKTQARVKLGLPIVGTKRKTEIDVDVALNNNTLKIPDIRLEFNHVTGPLQFSSKSGLLSKGIDARLHGKPLKVTVASDADKSVIVDVNGRVDIADVAAWSRQPALTFASGETDINAVVNVKTAGDSTFSVSSQLKGIEIDLPAPFYKGGNDSQSFVLSLPLKGEQRLLTMELKKLARMELALQKNEVTSALVTIQTREDEQNQGVEREPGYFTVTGNGPAVELAQWQQVLHRYLNVAEQYRSEVSSQQAPRDIPIHVKNLALAGVTGFGQQFDRTVLTAQHRNQNWWLAATNTLLSGEILIPDDKNRPYSVDLQRLHLPKSDKKPEQESDDEPDGLPSVDPREFGAVNMSIADVAFGDEHYGSIAFDLRSDSNGARFENLTGNIRGVHIREKNPGLLLWNKSDDSESSHITVKLDVGDLAKVLGNWNYEKIIESKTGVINVDLSWGGRPDQWALKASEGQINVSVKNGRFLAASDTASGTLKVVGIVNLANIARRLKLDFTDLYKSGISFDQITGTVEFSAGQLSIVDNIEIKSPSSGFKLRGTADLEQELLDMDMIVTLPVANNLPWIAAIAGGLPTAAGVYVVGKIFEDQFDRLSSAIYSVKGNWDNPELKFKRVFDQKKKKKSKSAPKTEPTQKPKNSPEPSEPKEQVSESSRMLKSAPAQKTVGKAVTDDTGLG